MSVSYEIYQCFQLELAEKFRPLGWKYVKSGPCLKKKVKDIEFIITMGTSWHNNIYTSRVRIGILAYCKSMSKKNCPASMVLGFHLTPSNGEDFKWWELIPSEKYRFALEDSADLLRKTILPLVESFEEDYEETARSLALDGYSLCGALKDICFSTIQFTSYLFGDLCGQQSALRQYNLMSNNQKRWVHNQIEMYLSHIELAKRYLSNGMYYVSGDVMYMVDYRMIALSSDGNVIFPCVGKTRRLKHYPLTLEANQTMLRCKQY